MGKKQIQAGAQNRECAWRRAWQGVGKGKDQELRDKQGKKLELYM